MSFFKWWFPFPHMFRLFQNSFIFWRKHFIKLFQSNQFTTTVTFSEQLFLEQLHFLRSSFFITVIFFEGVFFFRIATFSEQTSENSHFLRIGSYLGQELFRIKIFTVELPFRSRYFCTASTFSEKQYSALPFSFWRATFLERLLFQKTLFQKTLLTATFSEELLFYNVFFQKSYYFTDTLSFLSYTYYLPVSN